MFHISLLDTNYAFTIIIIILILLLLLDRNEPQLKSPINFQCIPITSVDTNPILCAHFTSCKERTNAKKTASWDVPSCSLMETYQPLRATYLQQLVFLKRLRISSRFYCVSHPRSIFHRHRRENLKHTEAVMTFATMTIRSARVFLLQRYHLTYII
jgi:hypothetical protein